MAFIGTWPMLTGSKQLSWLASQTRQRSNAAEAAAAASRRRLVGRAVHSAGASGDARRKGAAAMRVAGEGDCVDVHYTCFLDDGTQWDTSRNGDPLNFVIGGGQVIRGFDYAVRGLGVGERRRTRVGAELAYGEWSQELIMSVKRSKVEAQMEVKVGNRVGLSNGMTAVVVHINDECIRLDANDELAGKALTFDIQLVAFNEAVLGAVAHGLQRAVFALGCFWGAQLAFQRVHGVVNTTVGYTQGHTVRPSYEEVCSGRSGHAEAIAVEYDESVVSYEQLVHVFWERLGEWALTEKRVRNDVGTQYRSGIYWMDERQRRVAEESRRVASERFGRTVAVEVCDGSESAFYVAERYHQRLLEKGGQSAAKGATQPIRWYG